MDATGAAHDAAASYGSACEACVRAKCRCVVREEIGRCERCHRLDKSCHPSTSKRRLKPSNVRAGRIAKSSIGADTTRLEKKLDDLVSMLASNPTTTLTTASRPSTTAQDDRTTETRHPTVAATEAEESLAAFSAHMYKFFSCVYIPSGTTADELRTQRPFLLLCMAAVTVRPAERQRELFETMRKTLAQKLVVKSEPSIDLLLGLLTILSWLPSTYAGQMPSSLRSSIETTKAALSVYGRLAVAVANDLRLNHPAQSDPPHLRCFHTLHSQPAVAEQRTMEERRAVLACYLVLSSLPRNDGLRWTAHMRECLQVLETAQEFPLDAMLVQQVKINRVVEKANLAASYHSTFEATENGATLPLIYMQSMLGELDNLKRDLPSCLQQDVILAAFHHTAKLQIRCMAVSWPECTSEHQPNLAQLQNLSACIDLIQPVFDSFFAIPLTDYVGIPFPVFSLLRLSFGMLFFLSTLDSPGWDKVEVRRQIDILATIDRVVDNFRQASRLEASGKHDGDEDNPMARMASHLRLMKTAFAANIEQSDSAGALAALTPESAMDDTALEMPDLADILDMEWLMSSI